MLRRIGNKKRIAIEVLKYFPNHTIYIEPFFGAGGMFFSKQKARYNLVNDLDDEVYNFYWVLRSHTDELKKEIYNTFIHKSILDYWLKHQEKDNIKKAVRFLFLSNYSMYGVSNMMRLSVMDNSKKIMLEAIDKTKKKLNDVIFYNKDFREFLKIIQFRRETDRKKTFIYCDPPYLKTGNNYNGNSFNKKDIIDLLDILQGMRCLFAYSEFKNNDFIIQEAKKRGLHIINIKERQTIKNRNTEILITNYINNMLLF